VGVGLNPGVKVTEGVGVCVVVGVGVGVSDIVQFTISNFSQLFASITIIITAGALSNKGGNVVYESSGGTGPDEIFAKNVLLLP
jgi:hypothetical protein